jgi:hypothetical protein
MRPSTWLSSSHIQLSVISMTPRRTPPRAVGPAGPAVRTQRSARPRSSAVTGTGIVARSRGMKEASLAFDAFAPATSLRLPKATG